MHNLGFNYKVISLKISTFHGFYGKLLRRHFYNKTLKKCGKNLNVFYGAYIVYPETEIGDNCTIEEHCVISLCKIGDNVIFAANVSLMSGGHHHSVGDIHNTFYESVSSLKKLNLGDNLWIGTRSVIMNDISSNCIIGAGCVLTKSYPDYSVIVGVPGKIMKSRK